MEPIKLTTPLTHEKVKSLKAGDNILLSGTIYTARDAAHKKICAAIESGEQLPFDLKDSIIYYVGPCPAKEGEIIGSCGPTTSGRMDAYAPKLIALGETGMIGKGQRTAEVYAAMKKYGAIYFGAIGGCGALIAKCVKSVEEISYPELLSESVKKLEVEDFPLFIIADSFGNCMYK
ncbi:MAG: Fe-S-containing hydro-lyase [Bacillota bacterium]|nr:Fe-S-containing hydro-lyase [Bacillota bacterium]